MSHPPSPAPSSQPRSQPPSPVCDEAALDEAAQDEAVCDEAACDEATQDEAVCDEAACDEAVCDEAACDEAACDEAACDEAVEAVEAVRDEAGSKAGEAQVRPRKKKRRKKAPAPASPPTDMELDLDVEKERDANRRWAAERRVDAACDIAYATIRRMCEGDPSLTKVRKLTDRAAMERAVADCPGDEVPAALSDAPAHIATLAAMVDLCTKEGDTLRPCRYLRPSGCTPIAFKTINLTLAFGDDCIKAQRLVSAQEVLKCLKEVCGECETLEYARARLMAGLQREPSRSIGYVLVGQGIISLLQEMVRDPMCEVGPGGTLFDHARAALEQQEADMRRIEELIGPLDCLRYLDRMTVSDERLMAMMESVVVERTGVNPTHLLSLDMSELRSGGEFEGLLKRLVQAQARRVAKRLVK